MARGPSIAGSRELGRNGERVYFVRFDIRAGRTITIHGGIIVIVCDLELVIPKGSFLV